MTVNDDNLLESLNIRAVELDNFDHQAVWVEGYGILLHCSTMSREDVLRAAWDVWLAESV